jgi:hypothetical protein
MPGDAHPRQAVSGKRDDLNTDWLFESDNAWGVPTVDPAPLSAVPEWLAPYRTRIRSKHDLGPGAVHFFLHDYRFTSVWTYPRRALAALRHWQTVLSPDFSLYRNDPLALQLFNVYRNRWCQAYWSYHGLTVIPTVSWSTPESYPFAFLGLPQKSVVAVGTVGVRWKVVAVRTYFTQGWNEMIARLNPVLVLVYGKVPEGVAETVSIRCYPPYWEGVARIKNRRKHGR